MVLGSPQASYNGIANVKTAQNIIWKLQSFSGHFDWSSESFFDPEIQLNWTCDDLNNMATSLRGCA